MFGLTKIFSNTRREKRRAVPPTTFSSVQLALALHLAESQGGTFIQIGACDGIGGDPISHFVRRGVMRSILVEPVESNFLKLEQNYKEVPGVALVRAAIAHEDGYAAMYRAKESGRWRGNGWVGQVASFDRGHLLRHGVRPEEIELVTVPAITFATLLRRFDVEAIQFLQIDTEGFDAEVVKMALALPRTPDVINFERMHLTATAMREVFLKLEQHDYTWTHDTCDTLALHRRFTERWQN